MVRCHPYRRAEVSPADRRGVRLTGNRWRPRGSGTPGHGALESTRTGAAGRPYRPWRCGYQPPASCPWLRSRLTASVASCWSRWRRSAAWNTVFLTWTSRPDVRMLVHGRRHRLLHNRWTRAPAPAASACTSARLAIDVSPGVVMASAPCAAPYSTAVCGFGLPGDQRSGRTRSCRRRLLGRRFPGPPRPWPENAARRTGDAPQSLTDALTAARSVVATT